MKSQYKLNHRYQVTIQTQSQISHNDINNEITIHPHEGTIHKVKSNIKSSSQYTKYVAITKPNTTTSCLRGMAPVSGISNGPVNNALVAV
jgi:hypothetical protein